MEISAAQLGIVGYSLAGLFFFSLNILQIVYWRKRLNAPILFSFLMVSVIWALFSAYYLSQDTATSIYLIGIEVLRNFLAFLFLIQLTLTLNPNLQQTAFGYVVKIAYGSIVVMSALLFYITVAEDVSPIIGFDLRIFGHVIMAIIGLVLVEQVFRQSREGHQWEIKFLSLSFLVMFAFDFYLYSDAMLFKLLNLSTWSARGFVYALSVPLLGIAISRSGNVRANVSASRATVFYASTVVITAVYLIIMSVGGFYLQAYGGDWGKVLAITLLFSAFLTLFVVMFSGSIRARLRVFIDKHFLEYRYDYREQWLGLIRELSVSGDIEKLEERSLKAILNIMDCRTGCLWISKNSQVYAPVAVYGMDELKDFTEAADSSLVSFLQTWQWVINLDEFQKEPEMYSELQLPEWLTSLENVWLVVPLMLQSRLYGFAVLSRPRAEKEFNWEDIDLLKTVGRQIATYLAQERAALDLVQARQFEAFNRFSAYVVHDLKNLVSQLALVVKNSEKHKHNPAFMDDAILTVDNAVDRMNRLLAQLRAGAVQNKLADKIDLKDVLNLVIKEKSGGMPVPVVKEACNNLLIAGDEARMVSIIGHLVQNAQDATPRDGKVELTLQQLQNNAVIKIFDTGCGMDKAFIKDRLFTPFDTTKGLTGMGIGAHESKTFIEELGGSLMVESEPGKGTIFTIQIPLVG